MQLADAIKIPAIAGALVVSGGLSLASKTSLEIVMATPTVSLNSALSLEAEGFTSSAGGTGSAWQSVNDATASGGKAVSSTGLVSGALSSYAPRLDYTVNFAQPGTYYVWVAGKKTQSVFGEAGVQIGLDGQAQGSATGITNAGIASQWLTNGEEPGYVARINVATAGTKTLNLWGEGTGLQLDRMVVTGTAGERPGDKVAKSADDFIDSIGVNVHIHYTDTVYGDFAKVQNMLGYLGVRHLRDYAPIINGDQQSKMDTLGKAGYKFSWVMQPTNLGSIDSQLAAIKVRAGYADHIEGPNEVDIFPVNYAGSGYPNGTRAYMRDLFAKVNADPTLANIPVLQATLAYPSNGAQLGDLSASADVGNVHTYYSWGDPPGKTTLQHARESWLITPGKPVIATEGGYHNAQGVNEYNLGLPYDVHGKYMNRFLLEHYEGGFDRTLMYELADMVPNPSSGDREQNFGLFKYDGTPKPAAVGIHNMVQLLKDEGAAFTPGTLDYDIKGMPSTSEDLLLQKRDGTFYLVLWNDARGWDYQNDRAVSVANAPVTLDLAKTASSIKVYDPMNGTSAIQTLSNVQQASLSLPDRPLILEIRNGTTTGGTTPPPDPAPTPTPTPTPITGVIAIDAGGSGYTAADGTVYKADTFFTGGSTNSVTDAIAGTTDDGLYQTERWGNFGYDIPVANGTYNVKLQFAELAFKAAGQRVFDVMAEGRTVVDDLNVVTKAGADAAYEVTAPVTVSDGKLNLDFSASVDNPQINGIVVTPVTTTPITKTVGAATAVSGTAGSQKWGELGVQALDWFGRGGTVISSADGLGIAGGRNNNQIDISAMDRNGDGKANDSEKLSFVFPSAIDKMTIGLSRQFLRDGTSGQAEVGQWQAFGADGSLVGSGSLNPAAGKAMGNNVFEYAINPAQDAKKLVISAAAYANPLASASDSSDFAVKQIAYTLAA